MEFVYKGSVCSDIDFVKNFIDDILDKLNTRVDDKDILFDVRLILNELVINGVLHGNEEIDTRCVNLRLEVKDKKVKIEVRDEGQGIDYDLQSYDPEDLSFGGRGLVLVKGLSDELYIDRNKIIAIKDIEDIN